MFKVCIHECKKINALLSKFLFGLCFGMTKFYETTVPQQCFKNKCLLINIFVI